METFFFLRCMSLTITFYEEKKKNNIKSHNFVFQLQTISLFFFFKVKRKAKAKYPHSHNPPAVLPLKKTDSLKSNGLLFVFSSVQPTVL